MITLRTARLYDWPDILALIDDSADTLDAVARSAPCLVAEDGGRFAGFAMAERSNDSALVTAVGVLPGWRHSGVGSALAERLLDDLFDDGVTWAFVSCSTSVSPFFENLGFLPERADLVPPPLLKPGSRGIPMSRSRPQ